MRLLFAAVVALTAVHAGHWEGVCGGTKVAQFQMANGQSHCVCTLSGTHGDCGSCSDWCGGCTGHTVVEQCDGGALTGNCAADGDSRYKCRVCDTPNCVNEFAQKDAYVSQVAGTATAAAGGACAAGATEIAQISSNIYACAVAWTTPGITNGGTAGCGAGMTLCDYNQMNAMTSTESNACRNVAGFFGTQVSSDGGWSCRSDNGGDNDVWGCGNSASNTNAVCGQMYSAIGNSDFGQWRGQGGGSNEKSQSYVAANDGTAGVMCCGTPTGGSGFPSYQLGPITGTNMPCNVDATAGWVAEGGEGCTMGDASGNLVEYDMTAATYTRFVFKMTTTPTDAHNGDIGPHGGFKPCNMDGTGTSRGSSPELWFIDRGGDWGYGTYNGAWGHSAQYTNLQNDASDPHDSGSGTMRRWEVTLTWDGSTFTIHDWTVEGTSFPSYNGRNSGCSAGQGQPRIWAYSGSTFGIKDLTICQGNAVTDLSGCSWDLAGSITGGGATPSPTPAPTENPTENPTESPTAAPTENPTLAPTQHQLNALGGYETDGTSLVAAQTGMGSCPTMGYADMVDVPDTSYSLDVATGDLTINVSTPMYVTYGAVGMGAAGNVGSFSNTQDTATCMQTTSAVISWADALTALDKTDPGGSDFELQGVLSVNLEVPYDAGAQATANIDYSAARTNSGMTARRRDTSHTFMVRITVPKSIVVPLDASMQVTVVCPNNQCPNNYIFTIQAATMQPNWGTGSYTLVLDLYSSLEWPWKLSVPALTSNKYAASALSISETGTSATCSQTGATCEQTYSLTIEMTAAMCGTDIGDMIAFSQTVSSPWIAYTGTLDTLTGNIHLPTMNMECGVELTPQPGPSTMEVFNDAAFANPWLKFVLGGNVYMRAAFSPIVSCAQVSTVTTRLDGDSATDVAMNMVNDGVQDANDNVNLIDNDDTACDNVIKFGLTIADNLFPTWTNPTSGQTEPDIRSDRVMDITAVVDLQYNVGQGTTSDAAAVAGGTGATVPLPTTAIAGGQAAGNNSGRRRLLQLGAPALEDFFVAEATIFVGPQQPATQPPILQKLCQHNLSKKKCKKATKYHHSSKSKQKKKAPVDGPCRWRKQKCEADIVIAYDVLPVSKPVCQAMAPLGCSVYKKKGVYKECRCPKN